jgi:hypothetical protein
MEAESEGPPSMTNIANRSPGEVKVPKSPLKHFALNLKPSPS